MKLENAKKQCFAYEKETHACRVLSVQKSCKGCRFYKTEAEVELERRKSLRRLDRLGYVLEGDRWKKGRK